MKKEKQTDKLGIKIKKGVKLRDLTPEQYRKCKKNICKNLPCAKCIFLRVCCNEQDKDCWIFNKELYSDKFLDQEVEAYVEFDANEMIFTDDEKTYLHKLLKPYKGRITYLEYIPPLFNGCLVVGVKDTDKNTVHKEILLYHKEWPHMPRMIIWDELLEPILKKIRFIRM